MLLLITVYSKQLPPNKMSTFNWDQRPQPERRRRDFGDESTTDNSSSNPSAPYYSNDNSNLSLEELYEEDEMYFNAAGVYTTPPSNLPLEEETSHNSAFDDLDLDMDELDAEDEMYFNAASSQPV